ncbi:mitochondrial import inner membrane translocase subunit Tim9 [Pimephales promelas]|nr:mitochondrial import inner membrane translocase subunit Tim9 [Pimephales promelas]
MAAQVTESDQIKQFKEFLGTYNKLTENCFMDCVKDFTTREVKPEETSCSESCLQKYLKMTQRISMRFQEYHIQQNEALAAKAGFEREEAGSVYKVQKVGVADRDQRRRGGGGQSSAIGCLLWLVSMRVSVEAAGCWEGRGGAGRDRARA